MIQVQETDIPFALSHDAGHPDCKCSRCSKLITEDQCPIRMLTTNEEGEPDENSLEYRYCEPCMKEAGLIFASGAMNFQEPNIDIDKWLNDI